MGLAPSALSQQQCRQLISFPERAGSRTPTSRSAELALFQTYPVWREPANLKRHNDAAIRMGYIEPGYVTEQTCEGESGVRPQTRIVIEQLFDQPGVACLPAWCLMGADGQSQLRNRPRTQLAGSTSESRSNATQFEAGETLPGIPLSSADVRAAKVLLVCGLTLFIHTTGFVSWWDNPSETWPALSGSGSPAAAEGAERLVVSLVLPRLELSDLQALSQASSHFRAALRQSAPAAWGPALHSSDLALAKQLPVNTDMVACMTRAAGLTQLYRYCSVSCTASQQVFCLLSICRML